MYTLFNTRKKRVSVLLLSTLLLLSGCRLSNPINSRQKILPPRDIAIPNTPRWPQLETNFTPLSRLLTDAGLPQPDQKEDGVRLSYAVRIGDSSEEIAVESGDLLRITFVDFHLTLIIKSENGIWHSDDNDKAFLANETHRHYPGITVFSLEAKNSALINNNTVEYKIGIENEVGRVSLQESGTHGADIDYDGMAEQMHDMFVYDYGRSDSRDDLDDFVLYIYVQSETINKTNSLFDAELGNGFYTLKTRDADGYGRIYSHGLPNANHLGNYDYNPFSSF